MRMVDYGSAAKIKSKNAVIISYLLSNIRGALDYM